ncbi:hypothetical protein AC1031_003174 [Aphanomyces cochlioides]|nr:hypothetical protein AC1031_003174 [Aphanomyces cochlioides]
MVLFLYYFSAVTFGSASVNTGGIDSAFVGGFAEFFAVLPLATWKFSGIESLSTLGGNVTDPKRMIPKGQVAVMCTLLATASCTNMTAICMPPGGVNVASVSAIMNGAFSAAFNMSEESATVLSFPAVLFSATVFALPASNILSHRRFHSNANALLAIFLVSSALCPLFLYNEEVGLVLYSISMVFGLVAYVAQCAGFIYLRRNHKHMKRLFVSPVGIPGAVYAVVVFSLTLVSLLFCQEDDYIVLVGSIGILVLFTVYYHCYAKHHQTLSDDERALFFAHAAKFLSVLVERTAIVGRPWISKAARRPMESHVDALDVELGFLAFTSPKASPSQRFTRGYDCRSGETTTDRCATAKINQVGSLYLCYTVAIKSPPKCMEATTKLGYNQCS